MIAGIVWIIAGINVLRLGLLSYLAIESKWYFYLLSVIVFILFGTMFFKMCRKYTGRILQFEERKPFLHFFDGKSYLIMAVMMGCGIVFRAAGIFPDTFVAYFYSGLGCALALARFLFLKNYVSYNDLLSGQASAS